MRTRHGLSVVCMLAMLCVSALGCFEIEQTIELERDMSGEADLHIGVDFEPMILIMATMQRQMEGKEGPPTAEELAKAREEFKSQNAASAAEDDMPSIEEANRELPDGIRLLDMKIDEGDLRVATRFRFAFDELKKLVDLQLPSKDDGENVLSSPFENLELVEKGDTFTIRSTPVNPADEVEQQMADQGAPADPEMEKMVEDAFRNLRFVWKIKAPFEVVSHNATRVDGDTLIWEYDIARFKEMERAGSTDDMAVRVTYRK